MKEDLEEKGILPKYIIQKSASDPIILAVPSDLLIKDNEKFVSTIKKGEKLAQKGYIVTFGIKPDYPETGYGYIHRGEALGEGGYAVLGFTEKPDRETAEQLLASGEYACTSGTARSASA